MYKTFFGLTHNPFELSPDPSFRFSSRKCDEALESIYHAISRRKGFVVLTGEVGTGKTLVMRCLCQSWKQDGIPFANIIGPRLSVIDFLSYITFDLGIQVPERTKGNLLLALYGFLLAKFEKGLTTVLVIDEAHQLSTAVLEEIRMLTNLETSQEKLLQVVLVGQPELLKKLDSFELRQLKQRIAINCRLEPLCEEETRRYIELRLKIAGANSQSSTIFPAETVGVIYRYSSGIPRLVNSICEQALVAAHSRLLRVVPVEIIDDVAAYFRLQPSTNPGRTEALFSQGSSVPEKSWQAAPALDAPAAKAFDPNRLASHVEQSQVTPPRKSELSFTSIGSHGDVQGSASATTVMNVSTIETDRQTPATGSSMSGMTADAQKRSKPWQNRQIIASGIILLFVLAGAEVLLSRSRAVENAAAMPAPVLAVPPMPTNVGEKSVAEEAQSTQGAKSLEVIPTSESVVANAEVPKATQRFEQSQLSALAKRSVPDVTSALFGSLNAHPTLHHSEAHEIQTAPALNSGTLSLDDSSVPPGIVSSPNLPVSPLLDSTTEEPRRGGGQLQQPRLLSSVAVVYPVAAQRTHIQGDVIIQTVIDESGNVTDMHVVSGAPILRPAALDALRRWRYEPGRLDGQPVAVQTLVTIHFHI